MDYYHKYKKYKKKYLRLCGGDESKSKEVTISDLENSKFIEYLKNNIKPFLKDDRQHAGIITINSNSYSFNESPDMHKESGTVLFEKEYLQTIKPNQIIWRTYKDVGQKCDPPTGIDIAVTINMAYHLNIFNYGVVVAKDGAWFYRLKDTVIERMKNKPEDFMMAVADMVNILDGVYCHPDSDFIKNVDPKGELGIDKIESVEEYLSYIRQFFKGDIEVNFVKF